MGSLTTYMAFMPLYMWKMWDVAPVTHGRTDGHWKVVQYSVWAESAISRKAALESNNFKSIIIRISETTNRNVYLQQNMQRKHLLWWYSLGCPQTSCWRRNDIYLLQMPRHSSKEGRVREKVHTIQNAFSFFVCLENVLSTSCSYLKLCWYRLALRNTWIIEGQTNRSIDQV